MEQVTVEQEFKYYTRKAGDICRQLCLAGVAIIWLFHLSAPGSLDGAPFGVPIEFRTPLSLFILSIGVDVIQYLLGAVLWGLALYPDPGREALKYRCQNIAAVVVSVCMIWLKLFFMLAAYCFLLEAVRGNIGWQFPSEQVDCLRIGCTWAKQKCELPCGME